ncbi:MAG: fumarate hydratase [Thiotrichaceae bacterium]|nr:fumarate hydratase [Thiotrichaceae bacterium]
MSTIKQDHFIQSIADSLQYISYYHSPDFIKAMHHAWEKEQSSAAKDAITQILVNSRMCAEGHRPICQDTGIVTVFLAIGMEVQWNSPDKMTVDEMVNEGVRQAYQNPNNVLRASILADPAGQRVNTKDNTPAVIHTRLVAGNKVDVIVAAKGGGSENKARLAMLNPSDSVADWVVNTVASLGAGWCPPGVLGLGIGGTSEKAMLLAKEALMQPVNIHDLMISGAQNRVDELRLEIYQRVNDLGIGAQGVGGLTTALDVKILDYPTHAASLPVALVPNCAANRHLHFSLDGSGAAELTAPDSSHWPDMSYQPSESTRKINLDTVSKLELETLRSGETVLLSGKILTGRDAAHKRLIALLNQGEKLPVDLNGRFIYYVGPVDPIEGEVVGPAGPTTATRMDKFTEQLLAETGLQGMIGKAERGDQAIASIKAHKAVYLMAVGGAAYLVSKAIKSAKVLAFAELGMEAIYEFEVKDMPVMVAVDSEGQAVHKTGPAQWQKIQIT